MKTNCFFESWLWMLFSAFLFVGCTSISPADVGPQEALDTSLITAQPLPTQTPTVLSPTQQATLTITEQKNYVTELVKTSPLCKLPCWWGITPGKTTWQEAEGFLLYLGVNILREEKTDAIVHHTQFFKGLLPGLGVSLYEKKSREGIVDTIFADGNTAGTQKQDEFESFWAAYSPKQITRMYGTPSRVLLSAPGQTGIGDTGKNGYTLWIFYDYLGFMIRYDGTVADLPVYHFCPEVKEGADDIGTIRLVLKYPDHDTPLEETDILLNSQIWRVKSIQEATGMSPKEFHQIFSQDEKPACFDTPHDIWPVREP